MNNIKILDCTLRDGGYINKFDFGKKNIQKIIQGLSKAAVDIIECGFLKSNENDDNKTLFSSVEAIGKMIGKKNPNVMYVGMIQYGKITNDEISVCDGTSIDGIRVTFHEHEIDDSLFLGKQLMDKGYKVFMQPVGTMTYSDATLLKLIDSINELKPFAFYMVDTLGTMYKHDLLRMFYLIDHNLDPKIEVGFHSHNNLQLAFSNAQELMRVNTQRSLIIDSSIYGMGRGAGNLCTELLAQYINDNITLKYDNVQILEILDRYIKPLSRQYDWGYAAPFYISSINGCHPNYAQYLLDKQTLCMPDIYAILNSLKFEKRALYDREYIEKKYIQYMDNHVDDDEVIRYFGSKTSGRSVMIIAPGKSLKEREDKVNRLIREKEVYVISVNFVPDNISVDAVFVSNMIRFKDMEGLISVTDNNIDVVVTSNISNKSFENVKVLDYSRYLNENEYVTDNAGLMCINFANKIGVKDVTLIGFDGFSEKPSDNYYDRNMVLDVETERANNVNAAFREKVNQLKSQMKIGYLEL